MNTEHQTEEALSKQQLKFTSSKNPLSTYKEYVSDGSSFLQFLHFELITFFFTSLGGLVGFTLRTLTFRTLFKIAGSRPAFGKNLVLRGLKNISIGNKILVDDFATLDARDGGSISLGDKVSIGRFSTLAAKSGDIVIESNVNIGTHSRIATQSKVAIGESTLISAYCYIGPGNHIPNSSGKYISGEMDIKGGVHIGKNVWIGARATILDGVTIGDNAIIGAHSLVTADVPANAKVAGCPAKIIGA